MAAGRGEATEEPTPRRLAEARRRGEVAVSRELVGAAAFGAAVLVLAWDAPAEVAAVVAGMRTALSGAVAGQGGMAASHVALALAARLLAPVLVAVLAAALAVGLAQTRGLVSPPRVDLGRVTSATAWRRLFDGGAVAGALAGLLKVALVGGVAALVLWPLVGAGISSLTGTRAPRLLGALGVLTERLGARLALVLLAVGLVDFLLARRRHLRGLRMTRDEVRRDYKEAEGDPAHRGERQRLHRELLEQRMVEEVRRADFVVVNPDHIAVALRYDADGDAAPVVVAKGERLVAERIKQIAREAGVPVFRDVGLARSLAALAEGGEIPATLYEAVAEILRAVQAEQGAAVGASPTEPPPAAIGPGVGWKRV
jgi:type III secretion protein U